MYPFSRSHRASRRASGPLLARMPESFLISAGVEYRSIPITTWVVPPLSGLTRVAVNRSALADGRPAAEITSARAQASHAIFGLRLLFSFIGTLPSQHDFFSSKARTM